MLLKMCIRYGFITMVLYIMSGAEDGQTILVLCLRKTGRDDCELNDLSWFHQVRIGTV